MITHSGPMSSLRGWLHAWKYAAAVNSKEGAQVCATVATGASPRRSHRLTNVEMDR
jgi:hypothetical protein